MVRPSPLQPQPSLLLLLVGGATATLLISALLYLAPAFGLPFIDLPRLTGGLFTEDAGLALGLGYAIFFISGAFVMPFVLGTLWPTLPGDPVRFPGAALKGAAFGAAFFVLSGLLTWVLGWFNQLEELVLPGLFALNLGLVAAVLLLLGHLVYGVAAALVGAMGRNISPIDTIGWDGYHQARTPRIGREAAEVLGGNGDRSYKAIGKEYVRPLEE